MNVKRIQPPLVQVALSYVTEDSKHLSNEFYHLNEYEFYQLRLDYAQGKLEKKAFSLAVTWECDGIKGHIIRENGNVSTNMPESFDIIHRIRLDLLRLKERKAS